MAPFRDRKLVYLGAQRGVQPLPDFLARSGLSGGHDRRNVLVDLSGAPKRCRAFEHPRMAIDQNVDPLSER